VPSSLLLLHLPLLRRNNKRDQEDDDAEVNEIQFERVQRALMLHMKYSSIMEDGD
jgi:hypothetical protein